MIHPQDQKKILCTLTDQIVFLARSCVPFSSISSDAVGHYVEVSCSAGGNCSKSTSEMCRRRRYENNFNRQ